jgi:hypothetical protein
MLKPVPQEFNQYLCELYFPTSQKQVHPTERTNCILCFCRVCTTAVNVHACCSLCSKSHHLCWPDWQSSCVEFMRLRNLLFPTMVMVSGCSYVVILLLPWTFRFTVLLVCWCFFGSSDCVCFLQLMSEQVYERYDVGRLLDLAALQL